MFPRRPLNVNNNNIVIKRECKEQLLKYYDIQDEITKWLSEFFLMYNNFNLCSSKKMNK